MYESEMKIATERVPILIGKKGQIKRKIQLRTKTKLTISKEGEVIIKSEENLNIFIALPVIKAIGRGFNPDIAFALLQETYALELISLNEYTNKSKKKSLRLKSRLIGTEGTARMQIETMTNTNIVIYGKTIGIIGKVEDVFIAKTAIIKLLQGAPHGNAYRYIDDQMKKRLEEEFID